MTVPIDQLDYRIRIIFRIALLRPILIMDISVHTWPESMHGGWTRNMWIAWDVNNWVQVDLGLIYTVYAIGIRIVRN